MLTGMAFESFRIIMGIEVSAIGHLAAKFVPFPNPLIKIGEAIHSLSSG